MVPETGVYFLSFSVGVVFGRKVTARMIVGTQEAVAITRGSIIHNGNGIIILKTHKFQES